MLDLLCFNNISTYNMTLPDTTEHQVNSTERRQIDTGMVMKEVIMKAFESGRLTAGVFSCAKLLNSNPENVSICILPDVNPHVDVSIHIQHKLLEAYCWENDIPVLKVDSMDKLGAILTKTSNNNNDQMIPGCSDMTCVLVEMSSIDSTKDDNVTVLTDYYNEIMASDVYPQPIIELPV